MHTTSLRVRGYECDPYGHVNNAVYLNYLEAARDQLLTDHGLDYQELMRVGGGIWVAEANLKYVSPAVHGEELTIRTVQEESGAVSAVLKQTIWGPGERLVLEARMKLVWVSGGKPSRIPADWKTRFAEGLAP
jgi:YbgC/YbaW family acyl-CoA thioester hydrolase